MSLTDPAAAAAAALILIAPLAGACRAEETPMPTGIEARGDRLPVDAVAGLWSLRPAEGAGRCRLALSNLGEGPVRGALVEACSVAEAGGGEGWRATADGFELLGPGDRVLMRFRRTGPDGFVSVDGRHRLARTPLA